MTSINRISSHQLITTQPSLKCQSRTENPHKLALLMIGFFLALPKVSAQPSRLSIQPMPTQDIAIICGVGGGMLSIAVSLILAFACRRVPHQNVQVTIPPAPVPPMRIEQRPHVRHNTLFIDTNI